MDARLPYLVMVILVALGFAVFLIQELQKRRKTSVISTFITFAVTSLVMAGVVWLLNLIIGWLGLSERTESAVWIGAGIVGGLLALGMILYGDLNDGQTDDAAAIIGMGIVVFLTMGGLIGAVGGLIADFTLVPFINWLPDAALMGLGIGGGLGGDAGMFATVRQFAKEGDIREGKTGDFLGALIGNAFSAGMSGAIVGIIIGAIVG